MQMVQRPWGISAFGAAETVTAQDLAPGHIVVAAAVIIGYALD